MENALVDQPAASHSESVVRRPQTASRSSAWKLDVRWLAMICLLLGVSGAVRYWREFQFASILTREKESPFPLKDIPKILGDWRMIEGAEATLDPEIARIAGSSDHIVRNYENQRTGETATVLVLYGLAELVWGHTPEVCYPATGGKAVSVPRTVMIAGANESAPPIPFRAGVFSRIEGGMNVFHDVYYSFRNAGTWDPSMGGRWKLFRYNPGMFKVQVQRTIKSSEPPDEACNDLLSALAAEIDSKARTGNGTEVAAR
ncbi:exosortase-associated EpsI family protein [Paludisphaera rhizosphaerae]|uniref:exosortase-associated EpsI family protein n=1 Tax=Paludisphaera rhizosphaerae TaxID=2711216 RepID=UPI0013EADDFC|nr:exosortase-associated EpsI family protein [Paludisphaera rhizosphaerae]